MPPKAFLFLDFANSFFTLLAPDYLRILPLGYKETLVWLLPDKCFQLVFIPILVDVYHSCLL